MSNKFIKKLMAQTAAFLSNPASNPLTSRLPEIEKDLDAEARCSGTSAANLTSYFNCMPCGPALLALLLCSILRLGSIYQLCLGQTLSAASSLTLFPRKSIATLLLRAR